MLQKLLFLHALLFFGILQCKGKQKYCPKSCHCKENKIDCSGTNFTEVYKYVLKYNSTFRVTKLYLEDCGIENVLPRKFLKKFPFVRQLYLSNNHLRKVPDLARLPHLDSLFLSGNDITKFQSDSFRGPRKLKNLKLDRNGITKVPSVALYSLKRLEILSLASNAIKKVKGRAFYGLRRLFKLSLESNQIKKINSRAFHGLFSLGILKLSGNSIRTLKKRCFAGLSSLTTLNLKNNKLEEFPADVLEDVKQLSNLNLGQNRISKIPPNAFNGFASLKNFDIWNQYYLEEIDYSAFRNMASLTELKIPCNNGATKLTKFPDLSNTPKLKKLDLSYCNLEDMPADFCSHRANLIDLNLLHNKIPKLPKMQDCKNLKFLDLKSNRLELLDGALSNVATIIDLDLSSNHLIRIDKDDLLGLRRVEKLDLSHNFLKEIQSNAFESFKHLRELSLAHNQLSSFPTAGLEQLTHINTKGNPDMLDFPVHDKLPSIRELVLHYPYHCCYFDGREVNSGDSIIYKDLSGAEGWSFRWAWGNESESEGDSEWPTGVPPNGDDDGKEPLLSLNATDDDDTISILHLINKDELPSNALKCQPQPNAFYPCENLMTKQWLRICVWIVFLLAILGNSIVLFVIFANCSKFDVQRFLTLNLAFADLLLGIYLGMLAVVDIKTYGNFRAKALHWQFSPQCKVAGFIAVLSSELSVYTLAVITIERFITIKYSMYINKQLSVTKAVIIMIFGWIICIVIALLPVLRFDTESGVLHFSDYTKYSICLPFDIPDKSSISHTPSVVYLSVVLLFNICAFALIVFCYIKIFLSVRGSGAFNSGDSRVAKRVALLVFMDFACWFPICILALTAVYGKPLLSDLWITKVLTVFVFPLNACANPFLYAIVTKQFHKDCSSMYRQMKQSDVGFFSKFNKNMRRRSWKLSPSYQAFRRGSSCSFPIGRRCSTRGEELRMSSRSTYRTPMNTDDERERDRDDREDRREEFQERETCL